MRESARQIYTELTTGGYSPAAAVVQTAIALAESGGDDTARGDLGLQTTVWGPSYGLFQIRTEKAATGSGQDRDIAFLAASDTNQVKAAYDISAHGTNFTPWTTYTRGTYQKFLPQARAAAAAAGDTAAVTTASTSSPISVIPGVDQATAKLRDGLLTFVFIALGLALLGFGLYQAVSGRHGAG